MIALIWNIALALIWMALTGSFTGANLLLGFVLGYLVLALTLGRKPDVRKYLLKVPRFFGFVGYFFWELLLSNLRVAYDVLTPTHHMSPGVIAMPLDAETDGEITIVANLISLTPGTLSLDVSSDKKVLYIHVMYLDDRDAVIRSIKVLEARALQVLR
ncbi:Na(+) H(+) antiporter subunit E [Thioalkalivibrio nitratireducens DSM 14787]|uniref:Na(+) H(+) antiporter subunit E n=1 Tax=Thioalkalivibrio nitratireducens (strain DSM 14787 / UNIQEM 213 / ALEN2) TaxID=1255043 RepID=L0DY86_THIND|nr:Na+/H+ antiporter subunit E [Thioalkalivibrio nitratireducens]AGA34008.1 Na(+) H(+) antiporter subunit E [Thioalkalivibrio nitratireducens DSM 14787]